MPRPLKKHPKMSKPKGKLGPLQKNVSDRKKREQKKGAVLYKGKKKR